MIDIDDESLYSSSLAVLTKGPIGLLLPGLILLVFMVLQKYSKANKDEVSLLRNLKIAFTPLGIVLFFAIASPWYIAMYSIHGQDFIS